MALSLRRFFRKAAMSSRLADATYRVRGWAKFLRRKPIALVVDDDPDIAPLVRGALGPYAFASEDVCDGATALQRLRQKRYDLVILDLAMDGLNGFDILLTLRNEARLRAIPVIVLTADSSEASLARSFGYGADDFVAKPFNTSELGMRAYRLVNPLATS